MSFNPNAGTISGAADAALNNPTDNQVFSFDSDTQKWTNATPEIAAINGLQTALDTKVETVTAGDNVTVNSTDPRNPVISAATAWGGITGDLANQTDLQTFLASMTESGEFTFFLGDTADPIITDYKLMRNPAEPGAQAYATQSTVANEAIIQSWVTDVGLPGTTFIPGGAWQFFLQAYKTGGSQETRIYSEIYKRAENGTETLLGTTADSIILTEAEVDLSAFNVYIPAQTVLETDRLVCKVRIRLIGGGSSASSVSVGYGGSTAARLSIPAQAVDITKFVRTTSDQTVQGVKTFASSPIVPAPTTDLQAATKKYVDDELDTTLAGYVQEFETITTDPGIPNLRKLDLNYSLTTNNSNVERINVNGFEATWRNEWGALRGTSPYSDGYGDALVRAIRTNSDVIANGRAFEIVDRRTGANNNVMWGRKWTDGDLVRNGNTMADVYVLANGGTVPSTLPAGTVIIELDA